MRAAIQHQGARELLQYLREVRDRGETLTYQSAARMLGRDENNARAVAQMCDLLDAAAARTSTPLLALTTVLSSGTKGVNSQAWHKGIDAEIRRQIISRSASWKFGDANYSAIIRGLDELTGYGNRAAWKLLQMEISPTPLAEFVAGGSPLLGADIDHEAIEGDMRLVAHLRRERSPGLAQRKKAHATTPEGLRCEACKEVSGLRFPGLAGDLWEVHHKVPLSQVIGAVTTKLQDLAVLCPSCHRAIHRTRPMMTVEEFSRHFFARQ